MKTKDTTFTVTAVCWSLAIGAVLLIGLGLNIMGSNKQEPAQLKPIAARESVTIPAEQAEPIAPIAAPVVTNLPLAEEIAAPVATNQPVVTVSNVVSGPKPFTFRIMPRLATGPAKAQ
jgi:hypothetical protein